jgi:hypothetical protein
MRVRYGGLEIGTIDPTSLTHFEEGRPCILLLGGRHSQVAHVDWARRRVSVAPGSGVLERSVERPDRTTGSQQAGGPVQTWQPQQSRRSGASRPGCPCLIWQWGQSVRPQRLYLEVR